MYVCLCMCYLKVCVCVYMCVCVCVCVWFGGPVRVYVCVFYHEVYP